MFVHVDVSEVLDLADDLKSAGTYVHERAPRVVSKVAHDIQSSAQDNLVANDSIDTGNLFNSMSTTVDGMTAEVGPTAEYGGFVEEGTDGPYPIENAFGWGITVMHPGNAPKPYLAPAFDLHYPRLEMALGALGENAVRGG